MNTILQLEYNSEDGKMFDKKVRTLYRINFIKELIYNMSDSVVIKKKNNFHTVCTVS